MKPIKWKRWTNANGLMRWCLKLKKKKTSQTNKQWKFVAGKKTNKESFLILPSPGTRTTSAESPVLSLRVKASETWGLFACASNSVKSYSQKCQEFGRHKTSKNPEAKKRIAVEIGQAQIVVEDSVLVAHLLEVCRQSSTNNQSAEVPHLRWSQPNNRSFPFLDTNERNERPKD